MNLLFWKHKKAPVVISDEDFKKLPTEHQQDFTEYQVDVDSATEKDRITHKIKVSDFDHQSYKAAHVDDDDQSYSYNSLDNMLNLGSGLSSGSFISSELGVGSSFGGFDGGSFGGGGASGSW